MTNLTIWTIWDLFYFEFNELMTMKLNNLTTQMTNSMYLWTNSPEQLNRKWNNDGLSSLSQRWWKIHQRKRARSPLWQKRVGKSLSLANRDQACQKQINHILLSIFSVLKLTLQFLCWLIQHPHLKIHSIIELVNSLNKMMTLENFLLYQTCWKRMEFEIQPPY